MNKNWKLHQSDGTHLLEVSNVFYRISEVFYQILDALQNYLSLELAHKQGHPIIRYFSYEKCADYEIKIQEKLAEILKKSPTKNHYIPWSLPIFPKKWVVFFSRFFSFLFLTPLFYFLFLASIAVHFYFLQDHFSLSLNTRDCFILMGIFFFHELGHTSAAYYFTQRCEDIRLGLYRKFLPVFFSNLSFIWVLNQKQRIIVNLAGMYFQLLGATLVILFFPKYANFVGFNLFILLYNCIPYFRSDVYWVLSDFFQIPQLEKKSSSYLWDYWKGKSEKSIFLLVYSLLRYPFYAWIYYKFFFLITTIFNKYQNIYLYFLTHSKTKILQDGILLILACLFFYTQIRYILKRFKIFVQFFNLFKFYGNFKIN